MAVTINIFGFLSIIIAGGVLVFLGIIITRAYKTVTLNKKNGSVTFSGKNKNCMDETCHIIKFSSIVMSAFNYSKKLEQFDNNILKEQLEFAESVLENVIQKSGDIYLELISKKANKSKEELIQTYDFYYFLNFIELVLGKVKYMLKTDLEKDFLCDKTEKQFNFYKKEKADNIRSKFNHSKYNLLYQSASGLMTSEVLEELKESFFALLQDELIKILDNARNISIEKHNEKEELLLEIDNFYLKYTGQSSKNFIDDLL